VISSIAFAQTLGYTLFYTGARPIIRSVDVIYPTIITDDVSVEQVYPKSISISCFRDSVISDGHLSGNTKLSYDSYICTH
jgi:hypothetical protein